MSIKAGKVLTVGNGFLVDRLQSTGGSSLNFPEERILETGNELAVDTTTDNPQVSIELVSLDTTVETEAILTGVDETTLVAGDIIDLRDAKPLDIVSPVKDAGTSKDTVAGVIWGQCQLESASWRFGVRQNATQTFSLTSDSQYTAWYTPYRQEWAAAGTGPYNFTNTAVKTVEKGADLYALAVCLHKSDGTYTQLFHGADYTNTSAGFTLTAAAPGGSTVSACYFSATDTTFAQTVHPTPSVKPAAVRGKDIEMYLGVGPSRTFTIATTNASTTITGTGSAFSSADVGALIEAAGIPAGTTIVTVNNATQVVLSAAATATATGVDTTLRPPLVWWRGVQSVDINWRVQMEAEEELGNPHNVASDYDVPEVNGSITMRPSTIGYYVERTAQIAGIPTTEVSNLLQSALLELQLRINHPTTGSRLKTFRCRDARVRPPAFGARVNQKVEPQFQWASASGDLEIIKGAP